MPGVSPILTSILALLSMQKTPQPTTTNTTTTSSLTSLTSTVRPTTSFNLLSGIVGSYTFKKRVRMFSKTGFHLVMIPGGKLKGSTSSSVVDAHGIFELQSFGPSIIRMKNIKHQRYVAIAKNGKVYSTVNATSDTILKQIYGYNSFDSFRSYYHHGAGVYKYLYLAIKQNGRVKNARKVLRHHKSRQFQIIDLDKKPKKPDPLDNIQLPIGSSNG